MILVFNAEHWQKVFLKHKKKLAYDLEPREIITELPTN